LKEDKDINFLLFTASTRLIGTGEAQLTANMLSYLTLLLKGVDNSHLVKQGFEGLLCTEQMFSVITAKVKKQLMATKFAKASKKAVIVRTMLKHMGELKELVISKDPVVEHQEEVKEIQEEELPLLDSYKNLKVFLNP